MNEDYNYSELMSLMGRILNILTSYLDKCGYRTIGDDVYTEEEYKEKFSSQ